MSKRRLICKKIEGKILGLSLTIFFKHKKENKMNE